MIKSLQQSTSFRVAVALFLLALVASSPLLADGWYLAHDYEAHLVRTVATCHEMGLGDFYPRWLSIACLGKGSPVLNFYAPGFYLMVGYLHALGLPVLTALKLLCISVFFLGSFGMYLWTKPYFGAAGAFLSATLYMFVPYHFVDIYVRGALPEFAALALLPFLFYAIDLSFSSDRPLRGVAICAVSSAAIILTHNLSALMIAPFAMAYFVWCSISVKAPLQRILFACAGPLLGAGLSAFYWLPVLMEKKYLGNLTSVISGGNRYFDHFVRIPQFFSPQWGFGNSRNGMSFQIGYILLACAIIALLSMIFSRSSFKKFGFISFVLGLAGIFMTMPLSAPLYRLMPVFEFVQFPWRFLGPATLFFAAGSGFCMHNRFLQTEKAKWTFSAMVLILCVLVSTGQRNVKGRLSVDLEPEAFRKQSESLFVEWTEDEFIPKGSTISPLLVLDSLKLVNDGLATHIKDFEAVGSRMKCRVTATGQKSELTVPWFYFPGWQAKCDDRVVPVQGSPEGFIKVSIPPGEHAVEIWFGSTRPRLAGWIAAAGTLACICCFAVLKRRQRERELHDGLDRKDN